MNFYHLHWQKACLVLFDIHCKCVPIPSRFFLFFIFLFCPWLGTCISYEMRFLPRRARPRQRSKQKQPRVWSRWPRAGKRTSRTSPNPRPCRLLEPAMTNRKQPTSPKWGQKRQSKGQSQERVLLVLTINGLEQKQEIKRLSTLQIRKGKRSAWHLQHVPTFHCGLLMSTRI